MNARVQRFQTRLAMTIQNDLPLKAIEVGDSWSVSDRAGMPRRRGNKPQERCYMAQLQVVCLLRPGTQEHWRRLCQTVAGSRRNQFAASCKRGGITQVQVRLVQTLHSEFLLMTLHAQEPRQTLLELATSARPFDRWLREQLKVLLGWTLKEALPDQQHDLIFSWPDDSFRSSAPTDHDQSK